MQKNAATSGQDYGRRGVATVFKCERSSPVATGVRRSLENDDESGRSSPTGDRGTPDWPVAQTPGRSQKTRAYRLRTGTKSFSLLRSGAATKLAAIDSKPSRGQLGFRKRARSAFHLGAAGAPAHPWRTSKTIFSQLQGAKIFSPLRSA